jgi:hypothetical protein
MTREEWGAIIERLLARWYGDVASWRECGDHNIASMIRDGIGDVHWLLMQVPTSGDEAAVIRAAIEHLRKAGGELLEGLDRHQEEWTWPILFDVIEKLEAWPDRAPSPEQTQPGSD